MIHSRHYSKDFLILIIGQFTSLFGNSLQRFAISLYILDVTSSAAVFSAITAVTYLPQIFLAPFGGAIADRCSKQKIMVYLDFCSGGLLLFFTLFFLKDGSGSIHLLAILMCIFAVIQSMYDPSVRASIPLIAGQENIGRANSAVSVVSSLTTFLGPVAAGFLYGLFGIRMVFYVNIISFFFSAVMELFLVIPHTKKEQETFHLLFLWSDIRETFPT